LGGQRHTVFISPNITAPHHFSILFDDIAGNQAKAPKGPPQHHKSRANPWRNLSIRMPMNVSRPQYKLFVALKDVLAVPAVRNVDDERDPRHLPPTYTRIPPPHSVNHYTHLDTGRTITVIHQNPGNLFLQIEGGPTYPIVAMPMPKRWWHAYPKTNLWPSTSTTSWKPQLSFPNPSRAIPHQGHSRQ